MTRINTISKFLTIVNKMNDLPFVSFVLFVAKLLSDLHRTFDQIGVFEDLQP